MLRIDSNRVFFSSDFHHHHSNICRGETRWEFETEEDMKQATRDFPSLDLMDQTLVDNINRTVERDDILFFLGDWSFGGFERVSEFADRIDCRNIHLILGNHDHHIENNKGGIRERFLSVSHYLEISVDDGSDKTRMVLCHYPFLTWNGQRDGHLHLYGHLHSKGQSVFGSGNSMDVGIDGHPGFRPYSLQEIKQSMRERSLPSSHNELINEI
jgi:calcineurin-like phosphoesterase family protein